MSRLIWPLCLALLLPAAAAAQAAPGRVQIELLTMGAGPGLFARFGHAALRVRHGRVDRVYNFGHADFENPRLVRDFLDGKALFWVAWTRWGTTLRYYREGDRSVYRQPLLFTPAQAVEMARLLEVATGPRGNYVYHHFNDNCATRPRDLIDRVLGGRLRLALSKKPAGTTYRALIRQGFSGAFPVLFGSEHLLGRALDRSITRWQAGFLPRLLRKHLASAHVNGRKVVGPTVVVYKRRGSSPTPGDPRAAVHVLWLLAMALVMLGLVTLLHTRLRRRSAGLAALALALVPGVFALLPFVMIFMARIQELAHNELTLLFWPTDLLLLGFAIRLLRGRFFAGRWLRTYLAIRLAIVGLALVLRLPGVFRQSVVWTVIAATCLGMLYAATRALPTSRPTEPPSPGDDANPEGPDATAVVAQAAAPEDSA